MTGLQRRVRRETRELHRGRLIVIELAEGGRIVRVKEKGKRLWYSVTYSQILYAGAANRAAEIRAEKRKQRELKKGK
jgi:hypothetical protein